MIVGEYVGRKRGVRYGDIGCGMWYLWVLRILGFSGLLLEESNWSLIGMKKDYKRISDFDNIICLRWIRFLLCLII